MELDQILILAYGSFVEINTLILILMIKLFILVYIVMGLLQEQ